jgi:hypothetical protein
VKGLRVVALLCAAALAFAGCRAETADRSPSLVGAWRSQLQFATGPFKDVKDLELMYIFNDGGTMTESSNYDGAPPVPPGYGVWREVGPLQFEVKYEYFTTAPAAPERFSLGDGWMPSGRGLFVERVTLAPDGKSFTSKISFQAFNTKGEKLPMAGEATGRGVRMGF